MAKIIKTGKQVIAFLSNGTSLSRTDLDDETLLKLVNAEADEEIISIMNPNYGKMIEEHKKSKALVENIKKSKVLTFKGESAYWEEVSELTVPKELVQSILEAEEQNDEIRLETYKNFWTLMSLNPDEVCRKNLYWYLTKNELIISRSGFFVAYRNVNKTDEEGVYTDNYTRKMKIKIGEMVTMPREQCDSDSNVTCSRGLHAANRFWLTRNNFGQVGLVCLINPADVVAVPHKDDYGKLRTCAYLPIDIAEYGEDNHPLPYKESDGFECEYVPMVIYQGLMGTETDSTYKITVPDILGLSKESISNQLLDLALKTIATRVE